VESRRYRALGWISLKPEESIISCYLGTKLYFRCEYNIHNLSVITSLGGHLAKHIAVALDYYPLSIAGSQYIWILILLITFLVLGKVKWTGYEDPSGITWEPERILRCVDCVNLGIGLTSYRLDILKDYRRMASIFSLKWFTKSSLIW